MEIKNQLKSFFTEHWKYMAVSTACNLNIFDNLKSPKTSIQLAKELSLSEEKSRLILNALYAINYLDKKGELFCINSLSEFLTESNPESLKYACMNWSGVNLNAWQNLDYSIATAKSSFENKYETPFFEYLNEHPYKLNAYHKAMYEYARDDYRSLPEKIDFGKHNSVMDVGGSYGAAIEFIKGKYPNVECILFDLQNVVRNIDISNVEQVGGNFFDSVPAKSDAIILSRILHDWNDQKASLILKNCHKALPKDGVLYIIENCSDKIEVDLSLLSLNMTVMCESFERTSSQYVDLAQNVEFDFVSDTKLNELQTILIFSKT